MSKRILAASALLLSTALLGAAPAFAGPGKAQLDQIANRLNSLPPQQRRLLSSGMHRLLQFDAALNESHSKLDDGETFTIPKMAATARSFAATLASPVPGPGAGGTIAVSDPRLDYVDAVTAGFTQSETSSARCGNNVVAGYNDSGAFARTAGVNYFSAWAFSSASFSHDGGQTFTDIGFLNPGTNPDNFIAGDPVIACTSAARFYYASIFAFTSDAAGNYFNGVALNTSNDGGETWSAPIAAVSKDLSHGIDKPWLATDPTNPRRLIVTYTDFDYSGFYGDPNAGCPNDFRIAVEAVVSRDSGATWTAPIVIRQECGGLNGVQGSNVAVGPNGTIYIGYEYFPGGIPNNEIHLVRSRESDDNGLHFTSPVKVADVWPTGNFGAQQGGFRNNEFPMLAVDRSSGPGRGTLYMTWADGSRNMVPNLSTFFGDYAYPDVVFVRSSDGGRSFTAPSLVSPTSGSFTGKGRDQFFPGIAVDNRGVVGVCYYDRRRNPANDVIDRYCSTSPNRGGNWTEQRVSAANWVPLHAADDLINSSYIGDYDAVSSDYLLQNSGFFSSFEVQTNGNPDVVGAKFR
jgi:hypothetical protein